MKNISLWIFLFGITSPGAFVAGEIFSDSDKNYHQDLKAAFFFFYKQRVLRIPWIYSPHLTACFVFLSWVTFYVILFMPAMNMLLHRLVSSESPMVLINLLNCECSLSISNENISSVSFSNFYLYLLSF